MGTAGCRYTYGTDENTANRTFVNIKEVIYLLLTNATDPGAQLWVTYISHVYRRLNMYWVVVTCSCVAMLVVAKLAKSESALAMQRDGFIIEPFTASIATAAVAYTLTRDDYTFDAAYDINRNAAFLSAGKRYNDKTAAKVRRPRAGSPPAPFKGQCNDEAGALPAC